ncbi:MAG: hypothetical protein DMF62_03575 [Acidobacteria bacterium]|nr:MAG: hypothetical protein DMF62_03575 [Acidobacteriota bacterium]
MRPQDFCPRLRAYSHEDADGISWDMEAIAVDFISLAKAGGMDEAAFFRALHQTWPEVTVDLRLERELN